MKAKLLAAVSFFCLISLPVRAQVPQLLNFQGRVAVNGTKFDGAGLFKFALVNSNGTATFWSNDGTSSGGSEPGSAVSLAVSAGFYSVLLGDATQSNMTVIPATVFTNADVQIRTWFNDGVNGSQLLTPDQRIAAVGYAIMAGGVPDASITAAKLADGAVTAPKIGTGAVGSAQLASNLTFQGSNTFEGALTASDLSFSPAVTRNLSVPFVSFLPFESGINYFDKSQGVARYANSGGNAIFFASVFLPHEATVTEIKARVLDDSTTGSVEVSFWEVNRPDDIRGREVFLATPTAFASSQPQTLITAGSLSHRIDNINARYYLEVRFYPATASLDIRDVLINYTVNKPLP